MPKYLFGLAIVFTMFILGNTKVQAQVVEDLGALALVAPTSPMCAATNQTITVTVKNYGATTIDFSVTHFTVTVNISGASTQYFDTGLNSGTLAAGATLDVIVTTIADLSASGTQIFDASTVPPYDGNPANNSMNTVNIRKSFTCCTYHNKYWFTQFL